MEKRGIYWYIHNNIPPTQRISFCRSSQKWMSAATIAYTFSWCLWRALLEVANTKFAKFRCSSFQLVKYIYNGLLVECCLRDWLYQIHSTCRQAHPWQCFCGPTFQLDVCHGSTTGAALQLSILTRYASYDSHSLSSTVMAACLIKFCVTGKSVPAVWLAASKLENWQACSM